MIFLFAKKEQGYFPNERSGIPRLFFKHIVLVTSYMAYYQSMTIHRRLGENFNFPWHLTNSSSTQSQGGAAVELKPHHNGKLKSHMHKS